jgi:hypothetical protein
VLPKANTAADITAVACSVFPKVEKSTIDLIVGHAKAIRRDLSFLGDVATEIRYLIDPENPNGVDLTKHAISYDDVDRIIKERLLPNVASFAEDLASVLKAEVKSQSPSPPEDEPVYQSLAPARSAVQPRRNGSSVTISRAFDSTPELTI